MKNFKIKNAINNFRNSSIGFTTENSNIEMRGNREVKIEGLTKILIFSDDNIKVSAKRMIINFLGKSLTIKCMTLDSLLIQGFINNIEFSVM